MWINLINIGGTQHLNLSAGQYRGKIFFEWRVEEGPSNTRPRLSSAQFQDRTYVGLYLSPHHTLLSIQRKSPVETKHQMSSLIRERQSYSPFLVVIQDKKRETGWTPIYCRRSILEGICS